tara:strand:- start:65943 stop:66755 length:813 start_codon:yes stop_codon:yes gene_type:complete
MFLDIDYEPCQGRVLQENGYLCFLPPLPLSHWVQSFWQLNIPEGQYSYRSVPDNSVDLIINLNCPEDAFVVTPFSSSIVFELTGPASYFGIRFRLLGHHGLISAPLGEWGARGADIPALELLPDHILHAVYESLCRPHQFTARCKHLTTLLLDTVKHPSLDPRLVRFIRYCQNNISSNISLADKQCAEFGLSSRQLRRLAHLHLGLSPTEFSKVMRFQRALKIMSAAGDKAAWTGCYYDQPHFIREFKSLSGLTPSEFRRLSVLYNNKLS